MKQRIWIILILLAFVSLMLAVGCEDEEYTVPNFEKGSLQLGKAITDITPDLGTYEQLKILGYMFNPAPQGSHDELTARVLLLDNGVNKIAWIAMDTCFIDVFFVEELAEKVSDVVDMENIIISATHTHGGISNILEQQLFQYMFGVLNEELQGELTDLIANAIREANSNMETVYVSYHAEELAEANQNRRPFYNTPVDFQDFGTDKEMTILAFRNENDEPVALITNFASHPTLAPTWDDPNYTADYVGVYNKSIEQYYGGNTFDAGGTVLSFFVNGILGDAEPYYPIPADRNTQSWEKVENYGNKLSGLAIPLIDEALSKVIDAEIALELNIHAFAQPEVQGSTVLMDGILNSHPIPDYNLKLKALRLDDVVISYIFGEPTTPVGLEIKNKLKSRSHTHAIIVAPSLDYYGYFPSTFQYEELDNDANYERQVCVFGPETDQIIIDNALMAAKGLY